MSRIEPHPHEMIQVLLLDPLADQFELWLNERGLHLFKIPVGDEETEEIHTYGVGVQEWPS